MPNPLLLEPKHDAESDFLDSGGDGGENTNSRYREKL